MTKSEKTIQSNIIKWLNAQPCTWAVKFPGVLRRGVPDVLCCYRGRFVAFEVKKTGEVPTPIQRAVMRQIKVAEGYAHPVWSLDGVKYAMSYLKES
jgi:hypothetical protein